MTRPLACLGVVVLCAMGASRANAASGVGLYEPFPQPARHSSLERLTRGLDAAGRRGSDAEFPGGALGAALDPPRSAPGAASVRAGAGSHGLPRWPLALAALAGAAGAGALLARRRRLAAAGVAVALLGGVLALAGVASDTGVAQPAPAVPGLPADFVGLVSEDAFAGDAAYRNRTLAAEADAGVGLVRQTFRWSAIERRPGVYDFSRYDAFVASVARHGMTIMPVLFDPPRFRSSRPARGARRGTYPPRRPAEMGAFAAALVRRYGPAGTFWSGHPGVPRRPIRTWQVWNEPSLPVYWPSGPDAAQYVRLLKSTSAAIHAADPGAEVVTAGLPESRLGIPFERYVRAMYAAGARGSFDTLAIHPYAADEQGTLAAVGRARRLESHFGDRAALRVTELGWASGGPPSRFTVGAAGQARLIGRVIPALAAARELGLRGFVYFGWRDAPPYAGGHDFWGLHTGLLSLEGARKPAFASFRTAVRAIGR